MAWQLGSSALSLAINASSAALVLPACISRTRAKPSFSTAAPALVADQVSYGASLDSKALHSDSVRTALSPSNGLTAPERKLARFSDQAGLTPLPSGSGLPAATLASGSAATAVAVVGRSLVAR